MIIIWRKPCIENISYYLKLGFVHFIHKMPSSLATETTDQSWSHLVLLSSWVQSRQWPRLASFLHINQQTIWILKHQIVVFCVLTLSPAHFMVVASLSAMHNASKQYWPQNFTTSFYILTQLPMMSLWDKVLKWVGKFQRLEEQSLGSMQRGCELFFYSTLLTTLVLRCRAAWLFQCYIFFSSRH